MNERLKTLIKKAKGVRRILMTLIQMNIAEYRNLVNSERKLCRGNYYETFIIWKKQAQRNGGARQSVCVTLKLKSDFQLHQMSKSFQISP